MAEADDDTETQTAPAPAPAPSGGLPPDVLTRLIQQLTTQQAAPPTGTPDDGTKLSWTGLLGSVLGGGQAPGYQLRGGQADTSGNRALLNFGINTLLASGPHAVRPDVLSAVATGLQGAQESLGLDQRLAGAQAATAFEQNRQQQQDKLARIKEAIPLLTLQGQIQRAQAAAKLADRLGGQTPGGGSIATGGSISVPPEYLPFYQEASARTGIPVEVLMAQHEQESGFNPGATGAAGEIGIGQISPKTATDPGFGMTGIDPATLKDPRTNINFAADYLAARAKAAGADFSTPESTAKALAAYNGGGDPNYVQNVTRYLPAMKTALAPPAAPGAAPGRTAAATPPPPNAGPLPVPPIPPANPPPVVPPVAPTVQTAGPGAGTDTPPTPQPPPVQLPDINVAGVTFRHPGTSADFQAKEYMPPPATEDLNPNLSPQTLAGFNIRRQQLQLAQQQAQLLNPPDIPKALIDIKAKQADLEAEAQNAAQAKALSAAEKLSTYNAAQRKEIQTRYDNQITAYNGAATAQQASGNKIAEINAQSDAQANGKSLEDLNKATDAARDVVSQGQMALELSKAAGQPDFLTRNPKVADILTSAGMLPAGETSQLGAQRALDTTLSGLILKLKNEGGMSRFTDRDLTFLQNTAGSSFTPEQFRTGMLSAIISAGQRQKQYGTMVQTLHGKGVPIYDARNQADQELGSIIQQPPAYANITDPQARLAAQGQWVNENVPVGSFYKKPNGKLGIRSPPPQQQGQQ